MSRLFTLERTEDVSGVSGTGTVADGVEFPDGTVVIRWRKTSGNHQSTVLWESIESVLEVHGHQGRTRVRWAAHPNITVEPVAERDGRLDEPNAVARVPLTWGIGGPQVGEAEVHADGEMTLEVTDAAALRALGGGAPGVSVSVRPIGPDPTCMAHGQTLAQHHGRDCAALSDACSCHYFAATGMHWDTCPGRSRSVRRAGRPIADRPQA